MGFFIFPSTLYEKGDFECKLHSLEKKVIDFGRISMRTSVSGIWKWGRLIFTS